MGRRRRTLHSARPSARPGALRHGRVGGHLDTGLHGRTFGSAATRVYIGFEGRLRVSLAQMLPGPAS